VQTNLEEEDDQIILVSVWFSIRNSMQNALEEEAEITLQALLISIGNLLHHVLEKEGPNSIRIRLAFYSAFNAKCVGGGSPNSVTFLIDSIRNSLHNVLDEGDHIPFESFLFSIRHSMQNAL
jgi:hypothetical protein